MMNIYQEKAFWETIDILHKAGVLPYTMLIGSWAEFIYIFYFDSEYCPHIRTRDVDFLYPNIRKPYSSIDLECIMRKAGYVVRRDYMTQVVKLFKEDLLEIEFLTQAKSSGKKMYIDIPGIGIRGQSLRDVNILTRYPLLLDAKGYQINVPEPAVYALQKILINFHRRPASKSAKDMQSVKEILPHIIESERDRRILLDAINNLTIKEKKVFNEVCKKNELTLPE